MKYIKFIYEVVVTQTYFMVKIWKAVHWLMKSLSLSLAYVLSDKIRWNDDM